MRTTGMDYFLLKQVIMDNPSTGEVIDPKTKSIVTTLQDENGHNVMSEKAEIDFNNGRVVSMGINLDWEKKEIGN